MVEVMDGSDLELVSDSEVDVLVGEGGALTDLPDPTVQPDAGRGQEIAEQRDSQGQMLYSMKRTDSSKVSIAGVEKPSHIRLWQYSESGQGWEASVVSLVSVQYHLSKRDPRTGKRIFYLEPQGAPPPLPSKCPVPGCTKRLRDDYHLDKHIRVRHASFWEMRKRSTSTEAYQQQILAMQNQINLLMGKRLEAAEAGASPTGDTPPDAREAPPTPKPTKRGPGRPRKEKPE